MTEDETHRIKRDLATLHLPVMTGLRHQLTKLGPQLSLPPLHTRLTRLLRIVQRTSNNKPSSAWQNDLLN